jgi:hypothetical protein
MPVCRHWGQRLEGFRVEVERMMVELLYCCIVEMQNIQLLAGDLN